ncbi:hypothetical protein BV20DRAFT_700542 [Pilatotrama ljubarskyi]|nr:hypothetical protein BV20DRAFT_700542 [Pilatotrama ljubarskyi]
MSLCADGTRMFLVRMSEYYLVSSDIALKFASAEGPRRYSISSERRCWTSSAPPRGPADARYAFLLQPRTGNRSQSSRRYTRTHSAGSPRRASPLARDINAAEAHGPRGPTGCAKLSRALIATTECQRKARALHYAARFGDVYMCAALSGDLGRGTKWCSAYLRVRRRLGLGGLDGTRRRAGTVAHRHPSSR